MSWMEANLGFSEERLTASSEDGDFAWSVDVLSWRVRFIVRGGLFWFVGWPLKNTDIFWGFFGCVDLLSPLQS